jgi:hypothetical protein
MGHSRYRIGMAVEQCTVAADEKIRGVLMPYLDNLEGLVGNEVLGVKVDARQDRLRIHANELAIESLRARVGIKD